jgi:hypothetical protein
MLFRRNGHDGRKRHHHTERILNMAGAWLSRLLERKDDLGSKLILALVAFVLTTLLGGVVTLYIKSYEFDQNARKARVEAVSAFANSLFTRITLAEMVKSSMDRENWREALERKKQYDEAFIKWNGNVMGVYLLMDEFKGEANKYTAVTNVFEKGLARHLQLQDTCVTNAARHWLHSSSGWLKPPARPVPKT